MKKCFCAFLIGILLLLCCSCTGKSELATSTVRFYYRSVSIEHGNENSVITWEDREIVGTNTDTATIIRTYLDGSKKSGCVMPFPGGTRLKEYNQSESVAQILLSAEATMQTDAEFTVASICLAKTVMQISNVQSVQIRVDAGQEKDQRDITITADNFALYDFSGNG